MAAKRPKLSLANRARIYNATRRAYKKHHGHPDIEQLVAEEIKTEFASILAAFLINLAISLAVSYLKDWIKRQLAPTEVPLSIYERIENGEEETSS